MCRKKNIKYWAIFFQVHTMQIPKALKYMKWMSEGAENWFQF